MAASPKSPPYHLLALVIIIFIAAAAASMCDAKKNAIGFSSTLIHRDHPKSPLYNPKLTKWERVEASVRRSLPRMKSLAANTIQQFATPADIVSYVSPHGAEYVMEFWIGSPPVKILGLIDTGSDLTWVHCKPCLSSDPKQCGDPSSEFDPSRSSLYKDQDCSKESCMGLSPMFSCNDTCKYTIKYADGTINRGNVANTVIGFPPSNDSYNFIFGCGHENVFTTPGIFQGLVGLGKGRLSLIDQLAIKTFSHCFDRSTDVSNANLRPVIRFGAKAILDGVKTPILDGGFYFLHLQGISVGSKMVELPMGYSFNVTKSGTNGFVIDSGTTITHLEKTAYDAVVNDMTSATTFEPCAAEYDGSMKPCYCSITIEYIQALAPALTFHFGGGLNLTIHKASTWIEVRTQKFCLALLDSGENGISIFGNYNQQNINVGYDVAGKEIHFDPRNSCISTYECISGDQC